MKTRRTVVVTPKGATTPIISEVGGEDADQYHSDILTIFYASLPACLKMIVIMISAHLIPVKAALKD